MSFFSRHSRSSTRGHYNDHHHGSDYYKRPHKAHGIMGLIMKAIMGSKLHSRSHSHSHHHSHHHSHRRLWS